MPRLSSGNNLARPGEFGKSTSFVLEASGSVVEAMDVFGAAARGTRPVVVDSRPASGGNRC
jgi:hypothetical protein